MGDDEFERSFSREQFKDMIYATNLKNKLHDMLEDTKEKVKENGYNISLIEMNGEASRMPFIEDEIKEYFPSIEI